MKVSKPSSDANSPSVSTNWVTKRYPKDAAIMYGGSGARLSEESIRLWEKRSREYVKAQIAMVAPWLNTQLDPAGVAG